MNVSRQSLRNAAGNACNLTPLEFARSIGRREALIVTDVYNRVRLASSNCRKVSYET